MNKECPECKNISISENDWWDKYNKQENSILYFNCVNCKTKLGSTLTIMGVVDLIIWNKSKEAK